MIKGQPPFRLPFCRSFRKLSSKIALGLLLVSFLLNYQPSFSIPPLKQGIVRAQSEQTLSIESQSLPVSFQLPHQGYLSTPYSKFHPGIDLATGLGMPIKPVAAGQVVFAGFNFWGLGLTVTIDHGFGYRSLYAHLGKIYTSKDLQVSGDSFIGEVGLTGHTSGPHTHLEITKEGNSIDPQKILPEIRRMPVIEDFIAVKKTEETKPKPESKPLDFSEQLKISL